MTTLTTDPRTIKAREIATTVERWQPVTLANGAVAFRIPSQSGQGAYTVTLDTCSCEDARGHRCKHRLALALVLAQIEAQPTGLVARRVSDDEIAFEKARYQCRCSGSGSQGCGYTTQTAEGMCAHYSAVHAWTIDLDAVRSTEMRYRELDAEARAAAMFARL